MVSRRVRELEARLGSRLLHRTRRKLRLTEAGTPGLRAKRGASRLTMRSSR
ncbi:LysR family transcriptional regulator [Burkholderia ubonensis]|uniref:LysR family transcriptional regulator n=1 Tax=Burkholderia ubonensis TaxID=101571 RepID=UPI0009B2EA77|nr:LysR family transcriptional regulator [Burkholderia ubonensis]